MSNQQIQDAVGELANIMAGNFKALLSGDTRLGVPQAVPGEESNSQQQGQPFMEWTFAGQDSFVGLTMVGE